MAVAGALRMASLPKIRTGAAQLRAVWHVLLPGSDERVLWAIDATGRRLTGISTCLVRAIVVEARLTTAERPLRLTIGVMRPSGGALQSHAWVLDAERVLVGGPIDADIASIVVWETVA